MDERSILTDERRSVMWQTGCRVEGLLVCIAIGVGAAALLAVSPGAEGSRWQRLGLFGFFALWVVLPWFLAVCALIRPLRARASMKTLAALLLLFVWSLAVGAAVFELVKPLGLILVSRREFLADVFIIGVILTGSLALAGWQASRLWHWRMRSSTAEAAAWMARLQPHFLFNSLNGISELVAVDASRAEQMIGALSRLLRGHLQAGATVPLSQELALVRDYLALEEIRLGPRLQVDWALEAPLPDVSVPALCVQTLAENAVRHGIAQRPEGGCLQIAIEIRDGQLIATLSNELPPTGPAPHTVRHGFGLAGARALLYDCHGKAAGLETRIEAGRFIARLHLPFDGPRGSNPDDNARHCDRR